MITKQPFIIVEFKERVYYSTFSGKEFIILRWRVYYSTLKGLLFYVEGLLLYVFRKRVYYSMFSRKGFIILRYQEKGLLFCAKGFTILRFQEKGLLFYVFRRMAYYSTFLDERCLSTHIQPPYSTVSAKEFIAWANKSELQTT
jgi:hypothetical protein